MNCEKMKTEEIQQEIKDIKEVLKHAKSQKYLLPDQIQHIGAGIWRTAQEVDQKIEQLENEQNVLTETMSKLWNTFEHLIQPTQQVDPRLQEPYDSLVTIKEQLLSTAIPWDHLEKLRRELNEIETEYVSKYKHEGAFLPKDWKEGDEIPRGQAILSTLLNQCYKLAEKKVRAKESGEMDRPLKSKLQNIVNVLSLLKNRYANFSKDEALVEPIELTVIQDHLYKLEEDNKESIYSRGFTSASIRCLFEKAYDLILECGIELYQARSRKEPKGKIDEALEQAAEKVASIRKSLAGFYGEAKERMPFLKELKQGIDESIEFITGRKEGSGKSESYETVKNMTHSSLKKFNEIISTVEPVDTELMGHFMKLNEIKSNLKAIKYTLSLEKPDKNVSDLEKELVKAQEELGEIDNLREGGDRKFLGKNKEVVRGQALMNGTIEECYFLIRLCQEQLEK